MKTDRRGVRIVERQGVTYMQFSLWWRLVGKLSTILWCIRRGDPVIRTITGILGHKYPRHIRCGSMADCHRWIKGDATPHPEHKAINASR